MIFSLTGTIVDSQSKEPINGAKVSLSDIIAFSDSNGNFNINGDIVGSSGLSINGGLSVGTSDYFDSDVFIEGGLSINGAGDIGVCHFIHGNLAISGITQAVGNIYAYQDLMVINNTQLDENLTILGDNIYAFNASLRNNNIY